MIRMITDELPQLDGPSQGWAGVVFQWFHLLGRTATFTFSEIHSLSGFGQYFFSNTNEQQKRPGQISTPSNGIMGGLGVHAPLGCGVASRICPEMAKSQTYGHRHEMGSESDAAMVQLCHLAK